MVSNRKRGITFEARLCEMLRDCGFWAHNMAQNASGQPADVIASRNGRAYLIDCKVCNSNKFPLSRVEENQSLAMDFWRANGNGEGWFALKFKKNEIIMIPFSAIASFVNQKSRMNKEDIYENGTLFEKWVETCK